jgi:hypothetical protein
MSPIKIICSLDANTRNSDHSCDKSYHFMRGVNQRCEVRFSRRRIYLELCEIFITVYILTIFFSLKFFINEFTFANYFGIYVVEFLSECAAEIWHFTSLLNLIILLLSILKVYVKKKKFKMRYSLNTRFIFGWSTCSIILVTHFEKNNFFDDENIYVVI